MSQVMAFKKISDWWASDDRTSLRLSSTTLSCRSPELTDGQLQTTALRE